MKVVLGQNIRKIRKHWKLGQGDFGAIFDTTRPTLSSYENNNSKPDIFFLVKLQQLSHVNAFDLLYNDFQENVISKSPDHDNMEIAPQTLELEARELRKTLEGKMIDIQKNEDRLRELEDKVAKIMNDSILSKKQ